MDELSRIIEINPPLFRKPVEDIINFATWKMWYELGCSLLELFNNEAIVGERLDIYQNYITRYAKYLRPDHLVDIIILSSSDIASPQKQQDFIQEQSEYLQESELTKLLALKIVQLKTQNGLFEDAALLLQEIKNTLNEQSPMSVRIQYYRSLCELDKASSNFDALYYDSLLYLSVSQNISDLVLCFDMCIAGLISKSVISFQELATHPVIKTLVGTENEWLHDLIIALENGDPDILDVFDQTFASKLQAHPMFKTYITHIRSKVQMSVFLELIFSKPYNARTLTFAEIANACKINIDQVEYLALRALSSGVIEGTIDEIDQTIVVQWIKPKGLSTGKIVHLRDQFRDWISTVERLRVKMQSQSEGVLN